MKTRRSKRMEEKEATSQKLIPGLLRPFDAKNFVRIDQDLLKSLDNFNADEAYNSSTPIAGQTKIAEKSSCDMPINESLTCSKSSADLSQRSCSTTPQNIRTSSGYSLRTSRKRPPRGYSPEASPRDVKPTKTSTAENETTKSFPSLSNNIKKNVEQEDSVSSRTSPAPSTSSQPLRIKRTPKPKMLSLPTSEARKIRYGWFLQDMDSMLVVKSSEHEFHSPDPDEYMCFNEKKAWAGEYIMCIGQKNLCKWL